MIELPEFTDIQKRGIYILLGAALAIGGLFFSLSQGSASIAKPAISLPSRAPKPSIPSTIVVDVAGKVLHPGVYTLPSGSRAVAALKAAGDALNGVSLTDINLAHILMDGEQIIVGAPPTVLARSSVGGGAKKSASAIVNINTGTLAQLETLAGVGPLTAQKIIAYRQKSRFVVIDDLKKVSGFGKSKFEAIKSQLRV